MAHINKLCHILERVGAERFGSSRLTADNYSGATSHITKPRKKTKSTCHHCKKPGHYRNQCHQLKRKKDQAQNNKKTAGKNSNNIINSNNGQTISNSHKKISNNLNADNTNVHKNRKPIPVYPPCETCTKTNLSTEKCYFGANTANRPLPRNRRIESRPTRKCSKQFRVEYSTCAQIFKLETPRLQSGTATDRRSLKQQNFHQIPILSSSNPRRLLCINTT